MLLFYIWLAGAIVSAVVLGIATRVGNDDTWTLENLVMNSMVSIFWFLWYPYVACAELRIWVWHLRDARTHRT